MIRHLATALVAVLLSGCAADRIVSFDLPLQRMDLPEPDNRPAGGLIAAGSGVEVQLTQDQTVDGPGTSRTTFADRSTAIARFEGQLARRVSVGLSWQDVLGARAKLYVVSPDRQPLPGDFSLALTGGWTGSKSDNFSYSSPGSTPYHATGLRFRIADYSLVGGYRLSPTWLLYGGPYWIEAPYSGSYVADREDTANDESYDFDGRAQARGLHLGVAFGFARDSLQLMIEATHARVSDGDASDDVTGASASFGFRFGTRAFAPPARAPRREAPARVVPAS